MCFWHTGMQNVPKEAITKRKLEWSIRKPECTIHHVKAVTHDKSLGGLTLLVALDP